MKFNKKTSPGWELPDDCDLTVNVYTRPHLRDEGLEYERFIGRSILDKLFDPEEPKIQPEVNALFLSFPEQWLNIVEQRSLYRRLGVYCPNLKSLTIKTHSVYIIQCTAKDCVRVYHIDEKTDKSQEAVKGKLYSTQVGNIINPKKLNVLLFMGQSYFFYLTSGATGR